MTRLEELEKHIREIANLESYSDEEEFDPYGWSGGNIDDAFYCGQEDGEIQFARELLQYFE